MWRRITAYILFALGFLTIAFFRHYTGTLIHYPFLFWLAGFALFGIAFLFLRYTSSTGELKTQQQLNTLIADLKANGEKILVNLNDCELKEHHYTEERQRYGHKNEWLNTSVERQVQAMNVLTGKPERNVAQVQVQQTVIIYRHHNNRTGQTERFVSRVLPQDKTTLLFYLDQQKQTALYVDKTNRERYYFDLAFLGYEV